MLNCPHCNASIGEPLPLKCPHCKRSLDSAGDKLAGNRPTLDRTMSLKSWKSGGKSPSDPATQPVLGPNDATLDQPPLAPRQSVTLAVRKLSAGDIELLTNTWMRAMSLKDPAAAHSDRPDHGPMGSYDGWPPLTMDVMCRFGVFDKAVNFLRAVEPVTHEGPFAQSHEFLGPDSRGFDPVVRIAYRGGQDFNEGCGAAFAEVIIRSFFGCRPDLPGAGLPLLAPLTPRGFNGQLRHVPFHGKLYTLTSDAQGIHKEKE